MHMESTLNKNIAMCNDNVEKLCLEDDRLFYIRHRLLSQERSLYKPDRIHITPDAGVSLLVADVKRTLRHHQQSVTDTSRQHSSHSGQQTRPLRKAADPTTASPGCEKHAIPCLTPRGSLQDIVRAPAGYLPNGTCRRPTNEGARGPLQGSEKATFNCDHDSRAVIETWLAAPNALGAEGVALSSRRSG
ncbi:hypothetical protein Bbelb_303320 [Branchiostoma belcheri]|nr:hypothetical protein Bbelb_303320 [Branchiostoma belcheri]